MQSEFRKTTFDIMILQLVALLIGLYLVVTSEFISQDGVGYIEQAKTFAIVPSQVIRQVSPGYPALICGFYYVLRQFNFQEPIWGWIYAAQGCSLFFRVLAVPFLYFLGKEWMGRRCAFWGVAALLLAPYAARYGSDVLREWPYIFFLVLGLWILVLAFQKQSATLFGLTGFITFVGFTVRPEAFQIVLYGLFGLVLYYLRYKKDFRWFKILLSLVILLAGFGFPAVFYHQAGGKIIPYKVKQYYSSFSLMADNEGMERPGVTLQTTEIAGGVKGITSLYKLVRGICEHFVYIFAVFWGVGLIYDLKRKARNRKYDINRQLLKLFIGFNLVMLFWVDINFDFMSKRHMLPLLSVTAAYIPAGIFVFLSGMSRLAVFKKGIDGFRPGKKLIFLIIITLGMAISIAKIHSPLHGSKKLYPEIIQWLRDNTNTRDVIYVSDTRLSLYAGRQGISDPHNKQIQFIVHYADKEKPSSQRSYVSFGPDRLISQYDKTSFTISARICAKGGLPNGSRIVSKRDNGYDFYVLDSGQIGAYVPHTLEPAIALSTPDAIVFGRNQYVMFVYNREGTKKIQLYVDGIEKDTQYLQAGKGDLADDSANELRIGRYGSRDEKHFNGTIDGIAVFDKALSRDQINLLSRLGLCDPNITQTVQGKEMSAEAMVAYWIKDPQWQGQAADQRQWKCIYWKEEENWRLRSALRGDEKSGLHCNIYEKIK